MIYHAKFYVGKVEARQRAANADKCICYIEHHFNASDSPDANYGAVLTAEKPSTATLRLATHYITRLHNRIGTKLYQNNGLVQGGFNGRGMGLIKYCKMPALILEPGFVSNPEYVIGLKNGQKIKALAEVLADSIMAAFPEGGLVGFSVGHKYRGNNDLGAPVAGGGYEADYAEKVLEMAKEVLAKTSGAAGV